MAGVSRVVAAVAALALVFAIVLPVAQAQAPAPAPAPTSDGVLEIFSWKCGSIFLGDLGEEMTYLIASELVTTLEDTEIGRGSLDLLPPVTPKHGSVSRLFSF
ncbi:unnamed protein product [Dovyalis caffra]|uniref:Uncharacterized protein n=1 Tax=Dovyalis caffra TaxID=77055 RepID=A0AAV1RFX2_9ROSI|nr:unnamed protein product [Dovyalis caffra]